MTDDDSLYPYVNNDIKYRLLEDIVDSYYLDSQIKDDFQCDHDCYSQHRDLTNDSHSNACTHDYHHITQSVQDLTDSTQQNNLHSMEENASSFTDDTNTHCDFSIVNHNSDTENMNDTCTHFPPKQPGIHSQRKHAYRNTFGDSHIQYHDFDNQDSLTFRDKYMALLQQELQNNDQKLPNFQRHGHRDNATCNVFHRRSGHNYQNQPRTLSDNRIQ